MSGTVPLRTAALLAVASRLAAQVTAATVERARRAPVDADAETLPRLVVVGGDLPSDPTAEAGRTHFTVEFAVTGYARAADGTTGATADASAEDALSLLHAQVVAALDGWTPSDAGLADAQHQGADFTLYDAEACARPAGEFTARFAMLAVGPTGGAFSS